MREHRLVTLLAPGSTHRLGAQLLPPQLDASFQYFERAIKRQQQLNELVRATAQQAQLRQEKHFDKLCKGPKAFQVGDWVWVFCRIIPAGDTAKLLRGWRGPFRLTDVHQGGR